MIQKAVSSLSRSPIEANQVSLYGGNLEAFIKRTLGKSQRELCFEYGGRTFKLTWLIIRDMGTLYLVGFNELPSVPSLAESSLSKYPEMAAYSVACFLLSGGRIWAYYVTDGGSGGFSPANGGNSAQRSESRARCCGVNDLRGDGYDRHG